MFVELHIVQSFPPSNLNRDDTGAPKDATFGGVRRARISSQCLKRTIRTETSFAQTLEGHLGIRTKKLLDRVLEELGAEDDEDTENAVRVIVKAMGLDFDSKHPRETQYLLYIGQHFVAQLAELVKENKDTLLSLVESGNAASNDKESDSKKGKKKATRGRQAKKEGAAALQAAAPDLVKEAKGLLKNATREADVALFGRMLADRAEANIEAAAQVAHALSTHAVRAETDFYTAVDDLNKDEDTGAGMMGIIEHQSACYYRFAAVNYHQLHGNLENDKELAAKTLRGFIEAAVKAIPTGKQNSFAALTLPTLVLITLRDSGAPRSLAGAFEMPIRPEHEGGLDLLSAQRMVDFLGKLDAMYGNENSTHLAVTLHGDSLAEKAEGIDFLPGLSDLLQRIDTQAEAWNSALA